MTEDHNLRRWDPARRGTYEVWYLTWNHPATDQGFWLRYIIEAPVRDTGGKPRGELWFARFDPKRADRTFAIHKHFDHAADTRAPFRVDIASSQLGHDHAIGELAGNGHRVEWNLRWQPAADVMRQLPDVMYARGGLGETTVLSPNPRVAASGRLVVDGEAFTLDRVPLGQTHLWGKKHAFAWTWARCAEFPGAPDALLELIAVRLQRGGRTLPTMALVNLELDGERHRMNQFRHVVRNRASWQPGLVHVEAKSPRLKVAIELSADAERFVASPYEDPDGTELWCSQTEIGDARITVFRRAGLAWREDRRFEIRGRAHFELGARTRDPSVVREHVLV